MDAQAQPLRDVMDEPFLRALVQLIRAEDSFGAWERKADAELLDDFVISAEARRELPVMADPGPDVLHRVELFYRAVALRIEERTGLMASPMMTMHHEGFGRLILTVGKLVAYARSLRDVHRFGFGSLAALARDGEKAVDRAAATIAQYPEVARG